MSQYLDKDGASRIAENFLLKQAEQDAILRNLQFDLKEAEHALVKTIQGPAPLNIRALTRPLDDYRISGNTVQNGTPTPSDPVDVVGCGELDSTEQQYKLPLIVNGTEYPIYLGQVPTMRRIKKLVLNGVDNKFISKALAGSFVIRLDDGKFHEIASMCSHFMYSSTSSVNPDHYFIPQSAATNQWDFWWDDTKTLTEANQWLADQYAAGTPVTVWYVLAVPETGIVNEPLHKIGDYADTISMTQAGVEISTTKGFNTITANTTVLPSNIEVKGVINNA